uniref:Uncharacterized protein n=1 Tax=Parascaris univalens TaxID=6257 RepID=A0A914ZY32_PARUN
MFTSSSNVSGCNFHARVRRLLKAQVLDTPVLLTSIHQFRLKQNFTVKWAPQVRFCCFF